MTSSELQELIEELRSVESDLVRVEAKRAAKELPQRLWQTFSAFANTTGGGTIILGLDEAAGFEVTGVTCIRDDRHFLPIPSRRSSARSLRWPRLLRPIPTLFADLVRERK